MEAPEGGLYETTRRQRQVTADGDLDPLDFGSPSPSARQSDLRDLLEVCDVGRQGTRPPR